MILSGLTKQVAEFPGIILAEIEQIRQQKEPIPNDVFENIQKSIIDSFSPNEILNTIRLELKKNISEAEAQELITWYESNLGRKITKAEEKASTAAAYKEMILEAQVLLADKQRFKLIRKIEDLTKIMDFTMQTHDATQAGIFNALTMNLSPSESIDMKSLKETWTKQKKEEKAYLEQITHLSLIYAYKDLPKDNIEKYLKFLEKPATQKFNDTIFKSQNHSIKQSIEKMKKSLFVIFKGIDGTSDFTQNLNEISSEVNKSCPIILDDETKLDNTSVLQGNTFQYNFTLVNYTKNDIDIEKLKNILKDTLLNNIKTNAKLKPFKDNKVKLNYSYKDKDGTVLFLLEFTYDDYK